MVLVAISGVIDFHELVLLYQLRLWQDVILWLLVFTLTVVTGVDNSIILAIAGCMMLLVRRFGECIITAVTSLSYHCVPILLQDDLTFCNRNRPMCTSMFTSVAVVQPRLTVLGQLQVQAGNIRRKAKSFLKNRHLHQRRATVDGASEGLSLMHHLTETLFKS